MAAELMHEGGKVWIAGMENLTWPWGQESSTLRSLAIALQTGGEDVDYEWLMGVSGLAFRIQVMHGGLCPSSPHACCGYNAYDAARAGIDYDHVPYVFIGGDGLNKDDPADVRKTKDAIVASIDKGWPVLFGSIEDGLVVGYADGGETLLVRGYFDGGEPGFHPLEEWPWGFAVLEKKAESVDRREAIVRSLQTAIDLARREKTGEYTSGFAALAQWAALLRLEDAEVAAADEKHEMGIQHGNAYIYVCMMDARTRAAGYLRSVADEFGEDAAVHVLAAADIYDRILGCLREGHANAPFPWQSRGKPWSHETRLAEAETLDRVAALERQAVAELETAVAAIG
jgi:hypothetical protein